MQAVVKTLHTEIIIKGMISDIVLSVLQKEYGNNFEIIDDEVPVNIFETDWYKTTKSNMKPGDYIRAYRGKKGWTQEELGVRLGGIPKQHVSNMERGTRHISLKMAQKLAGVFDIEINQFLHN
jgi:DNA-binding XRE family transcriptional regulator